MKSIAALILVASAEESSFRPRGMKHHKSLSLADVHKEKYLPSDEPVLDSNNPESVEPLGQVDKEPTPTKSADPVKPGT